MLSGALRSGAMRLLQLNLRGNRIGREGAVALVEAMVAGKCPLESLDMSDNGICGLNADGDGAYSPVAVEAVCGWLVAKDNPLRSLKIGQNQLCGVNWKGRGEYTSVAVEALCEALASEACQLQDLRIFGNCWGNKDAHKLAAALAAARRRSRVWTCDGTRWARTRWRRCSTRRGRTARSSTCRSGCAAARRSTRTRTGWRRCSTTTRTCTRLAGHVHPQRRRSDLHCEAVLKGHEKGVLSMKLLGDMLYARSQGRDQAVEGGPAGADDLHQCKGR